MNPQSIPFIPDDAPFNQDQRAWLNGFLAGIFSNATQPAPSAPAVSEDVSVYFATQSGTAERLAKKFSKELKAKGHRATIASLADATPATLSSQNCAVIFASTYGEGDAPDNCISFREALLAEDCPGLHSLRYAVFCLGDRNYEQFCGFGVELDDRLAALGGTRLASRVESDVDVDVPFAAWKDSCLTQIGRTNAAAATAPAVSIAPAGTSSRYSRENPFPAEIQEKRALTSNGSTKLTMHLALQMDDSLSYEAGDACGVIAQNDPVPVDEIISLLPFDGATRIDLPRIGASTVRQALLEHYQHTRASRKMVQAFAQKTQSKSLTTLLRPEEGGHLDKYLYDRGLIDLLTEYHGAIETPQELFAMLPRLAPRLYSLSSSPAAHGQQLHCTIAVVKYRSHNRERGGVASTMLSDRLEVGQTVPVYIQPNKKFRLPADTNLPIIMIGPGTGIAPFRAFLHERRARGHKGRNWLFFGERSAQTDFLYCDELREMSDSGHLTRLDTAFSRDQAHKIYVQDRVLEHGALFWRWLREDARIYICGDAAYMAKDVDAAIHAVVEKHGGMSADAAQEYVSKLHDEGRYHRDVY